MGRIKLDLPSRFIFSTEIPVQINHINYGGHLGNDSVLTLVHEARVRFLHSLGFGEMDIKGVGIIMADAVLVYKTEAFHGVNLNIEIAVDELTRYSFDLYYRLTDTNTGQEVARVKTTLFFFDYGKHKIVSVPSLFRDLIGERLE